MQGGKRGTVQLRFVGVVVGCWLVEVDVIVNVNKLVVLALSQLVNCVGCRPLNCLRMRNVAYPYPLGHNQGGQLSEHLAGILGLADSLGASFIGTFLAKQKGQVVGRDHGWDSSLVFTQDTAITNHWQLLECRLH